MQSDYYYKNAKTPRMNFFNEVIAELYVSAAVMPKKTFEDYLFTEREKRWKRKCKMEQLSKDVAFIKSDNPACLGYFMKRRSKLASSNLNFVKEEVQKLKKIHESYSSEIKHVTEENTNLYQHGIIRKGYEPQATYFRKYLIF